MKGIIIRSNGEYCIARMGNDLKTLQNIVDGYIEVINTQVEGIVAILDEEGKLRGKEMNPVATKLLYGYKPIDVIVGDVVLVGTKEDEFWTIENKVLTALALVVETAGGRQAPTENWVELKKINKENVERFDKGEKEGYHCTKCKCEVGIDGSYSNRGENLICCTCANRRFKGDWETMMEEIRRMRWR